MEKRDRLGNRDMLAYSDAPSKYKHESFFSPEKKEVMINKLKKVSDEAVSNFEVPKE
jgi:hypothetical protein